MNLQNLILQNTNLPQVIAFIIQDYLDNKIKFGIQLKFQQDILVYYREVDPTVINGMPPYNRWIVNFKNRTIYTETLREMYCQQNNDIETRNYFQQKIVQFQNPNYKIYVLQALPRIEYYIK